MTMNKTGIDHDAIVAMFSQATTQQGEALRKGVSEAVLKALQGRELTMKNIKAVLKTVTKAASAGAAQNPAADNAEALLERAFSGMDSALLQAVEANRTALQQFVAQGVGLREGQLKSALDDLEKMESVFISTVTKSAAAAGESLQAPWAHVLEASKLNGTVSGAKATSAIEQLMTQAQAAMRDGRALGLRTTQAMLDSYAALASGILIGMSEGLKNAGSATAPARKAAASKRATGA